MGFDQCQIDMILLCITAVLYYVLVSGEVVAPISLGRGLCQGDPLSPYKFYVRKVLLL